MRVAVCLKCALIRTRSRANESRLINDASVNKKLNADLANVNKRSLPSRTVRRRTVRAQLVALQNVKIRNRAKALSSRSRVRGRSAEINDKLYQHPFQKR